VTTPIGITHCINRLSECSDLAALRRRWDGFGKEYQHNEQVLAMKEQMKAMLK
jgi:hypothetical protein